MIDTHAHLTDKSYNIDREAVIKRSRENGITKLLCVCSDLSEVDSFHEMLDNHSFIYGAIGVHPHDASKYETIKNLFNASMGHDSIVAIGEVGLDYHYNNSPGEIQIDVFRKQLRIAKSGNLPVIIHSRDAMSDTLRILKEEKVNKGVLHCFSGNENEMAKCLELGLYISIAGPVTYPKAEGTRNVAALVPDERLVIETDCPYLSPQPVRGKRNEPSYIRFTFEKIAELRNITVNELIGITSKNAESLFNLH